MGGVPLPDLDGSLKEIEYVYDTLKVDAIGIYSNDKQGRWPGDPYFEPMWQELNRRRAIVYMHPLAPQCCGNLKYRRGVDAGVRLRPHAWRGQHRGQRGHVPLPEHPLHHGPFRRDGADAGGANEGSSARGRGAVPAERPLCGFEQMMLRGNAERLFPMFKV
jgi:hypothetical protein